MECRFARVLGRNGLEGRKLGVSANEGIPQRVGLVYTSSALSSRLSLNRLC